MILATFLEKVKAVSWLLKEHQLGGWVGLIGIALFLLAWRALGRRGKSES